MVWSLDKTKQNGPGYPYLPGSVNGCDSTTYVVLHHQQPISKNVDILYPRSGMSGWSKWQNHHQSHWRLFASTLIIDSGSYGGQSACLCLVGSKTEIIKLNNQCRWLLSKWNPHGQTGHHPNSFCDQSQLIERFILEKTVHWTFTIQSRNQPDPSLESRHQSELRWLPQTHGYKSNQQKAPTIR